MLRENTAAQIIDGVDLMEIKDKEEIFGDVSFGNF